MVHNDPKGYHFRQGLATYFTKTLNLGKDLRPPQTLSWLCRGLFVPSFRRSAMPLAIARTSQQKSLLWG